MKKANDSGHQKVLSHTIKLKTITVADYDTVYYPGGYELLYDVGVDRSSIAILEEFFNPAKPIGAACHAPALGLREELPFLVEDMLISNGAIYAKREGWIVHVVKDGNLMT